jgi:hypothetical protein
VIYLLEDITANTTNCMGIMVPDTIFNLVATVINGIKIVVPVLLIIWGMLDFAKAIIAKKEEDIKKFQKMFVSRIISAVLVFFIIFAVQLVFSILGGVEEKSGEENTANSIWQCSKNFINGVDITDETEDTYDAE